MNLQDTTPTIRVKPWGKDQGEFVEINADAFDPAVHTHFEAEEPGGSVPGDHAAATVGARRKRKARK